MLQTLAKTPENPTNPNLRNGDVQKNSNISLYELSREERIKENRQRMQKLGIVDLSLKLKSMARPKRSPRQFLSDFKRPSPEVSSGPVRRSSRLQNVTPVTYREEVRPKRSKRSDYKDFRLQEGSKPEVYTDEHEKLLGNTERSWTLFVDGYGADGKRIYDPVKGKTCHQCRQKTLGHRTHCSKCGMVQGQFCGDCLYMRYGEHVLEAQENPDWICPVCRGICNCSLCRQAKGWAPTGALYKKITRMGYKSVAHYLIQTHSEKNVENNPDSTNQGSVKRSLAFPETESLLNEINSPGIEENHLERLSQPEDKKVGDNLNLDNHQTSTRRSLPFSNVEAEPENVNSKEVNFSLLNPELEDTTDIGFKGEQETKFPGVIKEDNNSVKITPKSSANPKKRRAKDEKDPDSIGGRLSQRHQNRNGNVGMKLAVVFKICSAVKQTVSNNALIENQLTDSNTKLKNTPDEPSQDSIAGRLRQRRQGSQGP